MHLHTDVGTSTHTGICACPHGQAHACHTPWSTPSLCIPHTVPCACKNENQKRADRSTLSCVKPQRHAMRQNPGMGTVRDTSPCSRRWKFAANILRTDADNPGSYTRPAENPTAHLEHRNDPHLEITLGAYGDGYTHGASNVSFFVELGLGDRDSTARRSC